MEAAHCVTNWLVPAWTISIQKYRFTPVGRLGGLTGHQGAIRSAFFLGKNLPKETFIATGAAVACVVDLTRLAVYGQLFCSLGGFVPWPVVVAGTIRAALGLWAGFRILEKISTKKFRWVVGVVLLVFGLSFALGVIS